MNTNQDFKKWVTTLTQDQKKFNFNKVYRVLRKVDKEDKFRHCVKQLAIDWKVPLTRLTDAQLSRYRRESSQADNIESLTSESSDEEENWEVVDECGDGENGKEELGNEVSESQPLLDNSTDTSLIIYNEENTLRGSKDVKDSVNVNECHENSKIENTELLENLPRNDSSLDSKSVSGGDEKHCLSNSSDDVNKIKVHTKNDTLQSIDHGGEKQISNTDDNSVSISGSVLEKNSHITSSKSNIIIGKQMNTDNSKELVSKLNKPSIENNDNMVLRDEFECSHNYENSLVGTSLNKSLADDTSKNSECAERNLRENSSIDKYNCGDSNDLESEMRKLHEVLISSEEDGIANGMQSFTNNSNVSQLTITLHSPSSQEVFEDLENTEDKNESSIQSKLNVLTNTNHQNVTVSVDCEDGQEKNVSFPSKIDNGFSDREQCEEESFGSKICQRDAFPSLKISSDYDKNSNQIPLGTAKNNDKDGIISQNSNSVSSACQEQSRSDKEATNDTRNFHCSQFEKHTIEGKGDFNVCNSSSPFNLIHKMEKSGGKDHTESKVVDLPIKSDGSKIDMQACIRNRSGCTLHKLNISTDNKNKVKDYACNNAAHFSNHEKYLIQHWWSNYQSNFERGRVGSYFLQERNILDYENENWPEISNEVDEIQDKQKKVQMDTLLSEMEELEREKCMILMLPESTSESESAADFSDDDSSLIPKFTVNPLFTSQSHQEEETAFSTLISPDLDKVKVKNKNDMPSQPPLPLYSPPRTPPPPPLPPSPSKIPHSSPPHSPLSSATIPLYPQIKPSNKKILDFPLPPFAIELLRSQKSCQNKTLNFSDLATDFTSPNLTKKSNSEAIKKSVSSADSNVSSHGTSSCTLQKVVSSSCSIPTSDQTLANSNSEQLIILNTKQLQEISQISITAPAISKPLSSSSTSDSQNTFDYALKTDSHSGDKFNLKKIPPELESITKGKIVNKTPQMSLEGASETVTLQGNLISSLGSVKPQTNETIPQKSEDIKILQSRKPGASESMKSSSTMFQSPLFPGAATLEVISHSDQKSLNANLFISVEKQKANMFTKKTEKENDQFLNRNKKCRKNLREYNLNVLKYWNSKVRCVLLKNHSRKAKRLKLCTINSRNVKKNKQNKLRVKKIFVSIVNPLDFRSISYPAEQTYKMTDSARKTILPDVKKSSSIEASNLLDEHLEVTSNIQNSRQCSEEFLKHIVETKIHEKKETTLNSFIKERVCTSDMEEICETSEDLTLVLKKDEEGQDPLPDSIIQLEDKAPQCLEKPIISKMENEDDECNQYVDKSIPSNPIAFKYVEDEEDINIYFMQNSNNKENKDLQADSTTVSVSSFGLNLASPVESDESDVSNHLNEESLLNDLEISDEDSEAELYTRPRIINGFGVPFILPPNQEKIEFAKTKENVIASLPSIKLEDSSNYFQDIEQPSITLNHELLPSKDKDETSQPTTETLFPIIIEAKSLQNKELLLENNTSKIKKRNKSKKSSKRKSEGNLKEKNPSLKARKHQSIDKEVNKSSSFYVQKHPCDHMGKIEEMKNHELMVLSCNKTTEIDVKSRKTSLEKPESLKTKNLKIELKLNNNSSSFSQSRGSSATTKKEPQISNTEEKEKPSYQPSNIRKRLTSEVETIIPIKKDLAKPVKSESSIKNQTRLLKRSFSIPQPSSEKISNPVMDRILKGMGNSPPPKSFVLKEPETQKYVAMPYWCNPSSKHTSQSQINGREMKDTQIKDKDSKNPIQLSSPHCDERNNTMKKDMRKEILKVNKGSFEPNKTIRRSVSLNTDEIWKKDKERRHSLKLKKSSLFDGPLNQKSRIIKKNSKDKKIIQSNTYLMTKEKTTTIESPVPTQDVFQLKKRVENRKLSESLPSMPLIECDSVLESSDAIQDGTHCTKLSTKLSTNNSPCIDYLSSSVDINDPCVKVSIPISQLSTELIEYLSPPKRIKTNKDNDLDNISCPINKSNQRCDKVSITGNKTDNKDLQNIFMVENKRNKREKCKAMAPLNFADVSSTLNVAIISLNTCNARSVSDSNSLVENDSNSQQKTSENKTVQNDKCLKRCSSETGSDNPSKKNKHSPKRRNSSKDQSEINPSSACPNAATSQRIIVKKDLLVQKETDVNVDIPQSSKHNNPSETNTFDSLSYNEMAIKLKYLSDNNDLQISFPKQQTTDNTQLDHCSSHETKSPQEIVGKLHATETQESSHSHESSSKSSNLNKSEDMSNTASLTLRVKHPSLLQANATGELTPQQLPNGAQSSDQENKRHTWYVEPGSLSNSASKLSIKDKDNNGRTKSLFCTLSKEPNKKTELLDVFKKSVEIRKKEYEQIHDVIKCIDFDYKEKKAFIDSVKKLKSIDVVQQEIQRVTKEYENKLTERKSFFHQSLTHILDYFKDATDCVYLAFYVFLSEKVAHLCREEVLKESLLKLLKNWIRNDNNKHIFDQCDSAFNNDYEIIIGILREMSIFPLLLSGDSLSTLSQSPIMNACEDQQVDFPLRSSNSQKDEANLHESAAVEIIELDCSTDLVTDQSDFQSPISNNSQATSQNRTRLDMGRNTNSGVESPTNECLTSKSASNSNNLNLLDNQMQSHVISSNINKSPENREQGKLLSPEFDSTPNVSSILTPANQQFHLYSSGIENEAVISTTTSQELIHQGDIVSSHCAIGNTTPQLQTQSVSQVNSLDTNNWNNLTYGKKNCIPQSASNFNNNTNTKYLHSMHQKETQSHGSSTRTALLAGGNNALPIKECHVPSETLVRNDSSVAFAQNIGPFGNSVHSGRSEPAVAPLVQTINTHSQNVRGMHMQNRLNSHFNPEIGALTQPTYHHKTDGKLRHSSNQYSMHPTGHQNTQHLGRNNDVQKNIQESHNLARSNNCGFPNAVSHPHHLHHFQSNISDVSINQNAQFQKNCSRRSSQEVLCQQQILQNQMKPLTGLNQNIVTTNLPNAQSISHQSLNSQINVMGHNVMSYDTHNVINSTPMAKLTHITPQMYAQNTPIQHVHRDFSTDNTSTHLQQPTNQSLSAQRSRRQHPCQQTVNGRRVSVETVLSSQQTGLRQILPKPSSTQFQNTNALSQEKTSQRTTDYSQVNKGCTYNQGYIPFNPHAAQSSGVIQCVEKQREMLEGPDLDCITENDLNNLFNMVDGEKIMEIMKNIENNGHTTNQSHLNRNQTPGNSSTHVKNYEIRQTALNNIDNNLKILAQVPDGELNFNGVHITKQQLWKFSNVCREQVSFAGLSKDQQTTFIGQVTLEGRTFTEEETKSLMRGLIAMNAQKITTIRISQQEKEKRSKQYLIQTLKDTACKDVASYLRIVNMLKSLAAANDEDAQQAVREIASIMTLIKPNFSPVAK